jgi:hypothetical protein
MNLMKRLLFVSACLMLFCWPGHEAAAQRRRATESWPYGPMRRSYDAYVMTPYGLIGVVPQRSGYATYGHVPAGPYTICSWGQIADLPEDERMFWHDGESTYGPKYAGFRCINQQ